MKRLNDKLLSACCFITILSQLPAFVRLGYSSKISQIVWIVFFAYTLIKTKSILVPNGTNYAIFFICFFTLYVLAMSLTGVSYVSSSIYQSVILSFFIFILGWNIKIGSTDSIKKTCLSYAIGTIILSLSLYVEYFRGASIYALEYIYGSKNSAGVIIFTGVILLILFGLDNKKSGIINIAIFLMILFEFYILIFLKCRAVLVSIPVLIAYSVFRTRIPTRFKVSIILLCLVFFIALQNEKVYDILINNVVFVGRLAENRDVTGGRLSMLQSFITDMNGKWLFGDGTSFRESLPLAAIMKYGAPVGILLLGFAYWPMITGIRLNKIKNTRECLAFALIAVEYSFNSLVEQLSPFGPGARCFLLWLLFGIILRNREIILNGGEDEYEG